MGRAYDSAKVRLLDLRDSLAGRRDQLTPTRRAGAYVGAGEFRAHGDEALELLVAQAGLGPEERVLDIGCGIGRVARPLAGYLRAPGAYEGFDVVASGIDWCRARYVDLAAPFRFRVVNVSNAFYNPIGGGADSFAFPYDDAAFDVAFAFSLFTHLAAADADRYIAEAARVLRPGGRLLATFFILNARSRGWMARTPEARQFSRQDGWCAGEQGELPAEAAIAYEEEWVRERVSAAGLRLDRDPVDGWWSGNTSGRSYQDVVVAVKP